jgi:hypothetical protein
MNPIDPTKPEKAKIQKLEGVKETPIECLFNPNEYTFSRGVTWKPHEVIGKNIPRLVFGGGKSMTLKMQLFFDTYANGEDVRKTTDRIWKLMNIDETLTNPDSSKGRPPMVQFQWGSTWTFKAVITDISQKFTLFRYDGTPVSSKSDAGCLLPPG